MNNNELNNLILEYLKAFNSKDLIKLESLFSDNIILKDWERNVDGKIKVVEEIRKIFNSVDSIECKIIKSFFFENIAICVLKITINNKETLDVVDIIEFNKENKIISIVAYKK